MRLNRRQFIKLGAIAGVSFLLPWQVSNFTSRSIIIPLAPNTLTKYLDPLPVPVTAQPVDKTPTSKYYEIKMTQVKQKLHSQLPPTTLWGYDGLFPGPTIEARSNETVLVKWINNLNTSSYLIPAAFDPSLHGTDNFEPENKTVVHVHGARVPSQWDGHPEAWFTPNFTKTGPGFATQVYQYPNKQEACSLWYHDHALGQTRLNIYAGLVGLYNLRDDFEDSLNLPQGPYEVPLLIQDRIFDTDGALLYPSRFPADAPGQPGPWLPEFFGNIILVNGKIWPYLEVEPRKYRFRLYNGSNARFYNLRINTQPDPGSRVALPFYQIGSDQGFLSAALPLDNILLAPGERADIVVDFSEISGNTLYLTNDATAPFPSGDAPDLDSTAQIMQFRVTKPLNGKDTSSLPSRLREVERLEARNALTVRDVAFREYSHAETGEPTIVLFNGRRWNQPIVDKPKLGSTEIWNLINTTEDSHPIHLHLVKFQLLDRQPFDWESYLTAWNPSRIPGEGPNPIPVTPEFLKENPVGPEASEGGWKDTIRANPGQITRIIVRFEDYTGKYPWHCHILEHEDNEMMLQFQVVR
jgi:spore coat protein A